MLIDILAVLAVVYLLQMVLFAFGTWHSRYPFSRVPKPSVSIIIAARNEEENIARCLRSMCNLTYPREKLEILVVDDRSTDGTADIVRSFSAQSEAIQLITAHPPKDHLQGKANAVNQ